MCQADWLSPKQKRVQVSRWKALDAAQCSTLIKNMVPGKRRWAVWRQPRFINDQDGSTCSSGQVVRWLVCLSKGLYMQKSLSISVHLFPTTLGQSLG